MLPFVAPIFDETGAIARIWVNYASWSRIVDPILDDCRHHMKERSGRDPHVEVLTANGLVLAADDATEILRANRVDQGLTAAKRAASETSGFTIEAGDGGEMVNGFAKSIGALGFAGYGWTALVREHTSDALATLGALRTEPIRLGVLIALLIGGAAFALSPRFTRPIVDVCGVVEALARGELDREAKVTSNDEIGRVAVAVNKTREVLSGLAKQTTALIEAAKDGRLADRAAADRFQGSYRGICQGMNELLETVVQPIQEASSVLQQIGKGDLTARMQGDYRGEHAKIKEALNGTVATMQRAIGSISENADGLNRSAEGMNRTASGMNAGAAECTEQANVASGAATQISANLNTIATAVEEMSASVREISRNSSDASRIASVAVSDVHATDASVQQLGASSLEIGNVVKLITSIAEQTNLLALNATIEAARAGEDGRGFAVVANEVKELAKQTATATQDIGTRITAIQGDTKSTVGAIAKIRDVISKIAEYQNSIASAVEEQSATTDQISNNLREVARSSNEIAHSIAGVAGVTKKSKENAEQTNLSSVQLGQMSLALQRLVGQFKIGSTSARKALAPVAEPVAPHAG
ncbi:MAG: methyl-accepting chemotaxis protein [Myxococcales bacterium]|nr:methyl-accepting chemotaxis protein [Myxococcales bacterium]